MGKFGVAASGVSLYGRSLPFRVQGLGCLHMGGNLRSGP